MLTKDLIQCRVQRDRVIPRFIKGDDFRLLALAERLITIFCADSPPRRAELADQGQSLISACRDAPVARGMLKLLQDRSEFAPDGQVDCVALRRVLLARSAALIREGGAAGSLERFRSGVLEAPADTHPAEMDIYADLPENDRLVRFRSITPAGLLARYNVALVQALLLRAERLVVEVADPEPAQMRRLFRYLKFFRLLVQVTLEQGVAGDAQGGDGESMPRKISLVVDGPGSVFEQAKRYGMQLASFFPALCSLSQWQLEATVEWRGVPRRLCLDQGCGLAGHYRHFGAYVPEEIRLFGQHFRETVPAWRMVAHRPFLQIQGQDLAFPDFAFAGPGGQVIHLELFHRWHAGVLGRRLAAFSAHPELPLILGIDRVVSERSEEIQAALAASGMQARTFLFRDYPTVAKTVRCLDAALAEIQADPPPTPAV